MVDYLVYFIYLDLILWIVALRKVTSRFYVDRDIHLVYFNFKNNLTLTTFKDFSVIIFGRITIIYYILLLLLS